MEDYRSWLDVARCAFGSIRFQGFLIIIICGLRKESTDYLCLTIVNFFVICFLAFLIKYSGDLFSYDLFRVVARLINLVE